MNDLTKPWRGIPRELIQWNPRIEEEICIGCGMCVTGCGRMVYKFNFEKKKPVVVTSLNCRDRRLLLKKTSMMIICSTESGDSKSILPSKIFHETIHSLLYDY
jgi:ferredoxin